MIISSSAPHLPYEHGQVLNIGNTISQSLHLWLWEINIWMQSHEHFMENWCDEPVSLSQGDLVNLGPLFEDLLFAVEPVAPQLLETSENQISLINNQFRILGSSQVLIFNHQNTKPGGNFCSQCEVENPLSLVSSECFWVAQNKSHHAEIPVLSFS